MKKIVKKAEDCPFYTWSENRGPWCLFHCEEEGSYCALVWGPAKPCPLLKERILIIEFDLDQETVDFINHVEK